MERMSIADFRKGNFTIKKSKYGNKKTEYKGIVYDSRKEARYAQSLEILQTANDPKEKVVNIERQVKYSIDINGIHICNYILDFKVAYADGRIEYIDVKGMRTSVYILKAKLMKAIYNIIIKEV